MYLERESHRSQPGEIYVVTQRPLEQRAEKRLHIK